MRLTAVPLDDQWQPVACRQRQIGSFTAITLEIASTLRRIYWPAGQLMTCYVHQAGPDTWLWGAPVSRGTTFTLASPANNDFVLGPGTRISGISTPIASLAPVDVQVKVASLTFERRPRVSFAAPESSLACSYERLWRSLHPGGEHESWSAAGLSALLSAHVESAFSEHASLAQAGPRAKARLHLFRSGEQFMTENLHREIYMGEMAQAIGSSERNLRYAFDEMVGISPIDYLSRLRLASAHRALQDARPDRTTVSAVALKFGLWDLSRFARSYARLFDTLPKDTLARGQEAVDQILIKV